MADRVLVVNDLLCFLFSRYGKWELRSIRNVLLSFYCPEDISGAKELFFAYASKLPNADNLLKNRGRRDSDKRSSLELDDIFTALTTLDEKRLMDYLPLFVSGEPLNLPTVNLGEGDLKAIMSRFDKMESSINHLQGIVNKMAAEIAIRSTTVQSSSGDRPGVTCQRDFGQLPAQPATQTCDKQKPVNEQADRCLLSGDMMSQRSIRWEDDLVSDESSQHDDALDGEWETETPAMRRRHRKRRRRNRSQQGGTADINHEWPALAQPAHSVPAPMEHTVSKTNSLSNRQEYVAVAARPGTSSTVGHQKRSNAVNHQLNATKKPQPMLIGKMQCNVGAGASDLSSHSGLCNITAAKPYVGKAVFCIDNVMTSATEKDIECHIKRMGVTVLSCHSVQPRRSRWQRLKGIVPADRSTFRVCIPREQTDKLLVADAWPANITITAWRFIEKKDTTTRSTPSENELRQLIANYQQPRQSTSGVSYETSGTTDGSIERHHTATASSDVVDDVNSLSHAATATAAAASLMTSPGKVVSVVSERDFALSLLNNDDKSVNMDETIICHYDGSELAKSN